jgi:hypothetical protein
MDTSILKSKLQQKISHKIVNNLITEASLPLLARAAAGNAAALSVNSMSDDTDSNTRKTGGSRAPTPAPAPAVKIPPVVVGAPVVQRIASAGPHAAVAAAGSAIGTGLAYGFNTAEDAMDSDTWKEGGSRVETQKELLGLGGEGTFAQAWKDATYGVKDVFHPRDLLKFSPRNRNLAVAERMRDDVESEEKARKETVLWDNPNLKANLEWERQQRAANSEQDQQDQFERRKREDEDAWNNSRKLMPKIGPPA